MKILITGATNGMGKGVARALAACPGVDIVVHGRSGARIAETVAELSAIASPSRISSVRCDLTSLRAVRACVEELCASHPSLDGVFVNAGLGYAPRREETEDGLDSHFQVNYLSQFVLTLGLLERLEASPHGGRVVFNATEVGEMRWDDLQMKGKWSYEAAIGQGMMAKHLFYRRLHALYAARDGAKVSCFGYQIPKTVWSNQIEIIPTPMRAMATVAKWLGQFISIDECGALMAPLFVESAEETHQRSGRFLTSKKGQFSEVEKKLPAIDDPVQQQRLWDLSLELSSDEQTRYAAERLVSPRAIGHQVRHGT